MFLMEATVQHAHDLHDIGLSKPPPTAAMQGLNDDRTTIEINSGPTFGLDDLEMKEIA